MAGERVGFGEEPNPPNKVGRWTVRGLGKEYKIPGVGGGETNLEVVGWDKRQGSRSETEGIFHS